MKAVKIIITSLILTLAFGGLAQAKNDHEKKSPPGLEKKAHSGKKLPPGWQKKVKVGEPLDKTVYEEAKVVSRDDKGTETLQVEDKLIKVIKNTREIVEVLNSL